MYLYDERAVCSRCFPCTSDVVVAVTYRKLCEKTRSKHKRLRDVRTIFNSLQMSLRCPRKRTSSICTVFVCFDFGGAFDCFCDRLHFEYSVITERSLYSLDDAESIRNCRLHEMPYLNHSCERALTNQLSSTVGQRPHHD